MSSGLIYERTLSTPGLKQRCVFAKPIAGEGPRLGSSGSKRAKRCCMRARRG